MANMFEKYAPTARPSMKKIGADLVSEPAAAKQTTVSGGRCAARREAHHALAVAHGERQEGAEDDGGGARDDDCRDYPRVGRGAFGKVI